MVMKKPMTIEELIASTKDRQATPEDIEAFEQRLAEREKRFAEEAKDMTPDDDWYNRRYRFDI